MKDDKNISTNINVDDSDQDDVLLEEEGTVVSLVDSLKEVEGDVTKVADKILDLADATGDPEMKEIITSIANQAYGLAVDIKEAQETYIDLQEESLDEPIDTTEDDSDDELDLDV